MQIAVVGAVGLVFVAVPAAGIYWLLDRNYAGGKTVVPYRTFRACYALGVVTLVAATLAVPLSIHGALGTGPVVFAPLLPHVGHAVLAGLGLVVVALGAYAVAAWRS